MDEQPDLFSRQVQAGIGLFVAVMVYATAFGGLFALAFAFAYGRLPGVHTPQGVALALAPSKDDAVPIGHRVLGSFFGVMAACGQAWGAVTARFGFQRAHALGFSIDGFSSAYQRLLAGTSRTAISGLSKVSSRSRKEVA